MFALVSAAALSCGNAEQLRRSHPLWCAVDGSVLRARHHLQILQTIIMRVFVSVVDKVQGRDRPVCGFPDDTSTVAPLAIGALDLGMPIADTRTPNGASPRRGFPPRKFFDSEAIELPTVSFPVLADSLYRVPHAYNGAADFLAGCGGVLDGAWIASLPDCCSGLPAVVANECNHGCIIAPAWS